MNAKPDHCRALPVDPGLPPSAKSLANRDCATVALRLGWWRQFSVRVQAWLEVPFGYQDESGFHYDRPPEWDRDQQAGVMPSPVSVALKD